MKHLIGLSVVLTIVWLGWSGHFQALTLSLGAASLVFVLALSRRMGIVDEEGAPLGLGFLRLLTYLPWLTLEIVKSNLDVARRILAPGPPPIAPRIIRVRARQRSEPAGSSGASGSRWCP